MKLRPLIDGQEIRIDNHHRGDNTTSDFSNQEQDVHIHKIIYENKRKQLSIKIPLNSNNKITLDDRIPTKVKKELRNIFDNSNLRNLFLEDVFKNLEKNWKWEDTSQNREQIVGKIANAFGLLLTPYTASVFNKSAEQKLIFILQDIETQKIYRFIAYKNHYFAIGETNYKYALYGGSTKSYFEDENN